MRQFFRKSNSSPKKTAEKVSREIVIVGLVSIVVAGIAYATATIPVTCTTPGDCPDITPTFQSLNVSTHTSVNENEFLYSNTLPTGETIVIEADDDITGFSGSAGVGFSVIDNSGVFQSLFSAANGTKPDVFVGIREVGGGQLKADLKFSVLGGTIPRAVLRAVDTNNDGGRLDILRDTTSFGGSGIYAGNSFVSIDHATRNVGIGMSTTPTALLDVAGDIKVADTANTCASAADNGRIKYDVATDKLQVCAAAAWTDLH